MEEEKNQIQTGNFSLCISVDFCVFFFSFQTSKITCFFFVKFLVTPEEIFHKNKNFKMSTENVTFILRHFFSPLLWFLSILLRFCCVFYVLSLKNIFFLFYYYVNIKWVNWYVCCRIVFPCDIKIPNPLKKRNS